VPVEARYCPACGEDVGFPNVRLADSTLELAALNRRLDDAETSAKAAGYFDVLKRFGVSVEKSAIVIARPLAVIMELMNNPNRSYATYHLEIEAGMRQPEDNVFDKTRTQFENALFPNFFKHIRFGALTLDDKWIPDYGPYAMVIREKMISKRASVFEMNPFDFVTKYRILANQSFPPGFRASWLRRHDLAKAKLHSKLKVSTPDIQFPEILMPTVALGNPIDFVEAHIYGGFTRDAIEKIIGPNPNSRDDRTLWSKLKLSARKAGILVEER
jgi:hypothetical protein